MQPSDNIDGIHPPITDFYDMEDLQSRMFRKLELEGKLQTCNFSSGGRRENPIPVRAKKNHTAQHRTRPSI